MGWGWAGRCGWRWWAVLGSLEGWVGVAWVGRRGRGGARSRVVVGALGSSVEGQSALGTMWRSMMGAGAIGEAVGVGWAVWLVGG